MADIWPEDAPAPRLCHLIKWPDFDGYGFNLHAERSNPGQFIGKIDDDSPAQMAGLREGDRIVEVNGVNINNENHRQVVERIKSNPEEAKLLVVDAQADSWYREQDFIVKSSQMNVVYMKTPVPRPKPDSPRAKSHKQHVATGGVSESSQPNSGTTSEHITESNEVKPEQHQQQQQQQQEQTQQQQPDDDKQQKQQQDTETAPESPSDFNDDSIDPLSATSQHSNKDEVVHQVHPATPMSPDSGEGDEFDQRQQLSPTEASNITNCVATKVSSNTSANNTIDEFVVTIEAEINRQSPVQQQQEPTTKQQAVANNELAATVTTAASSLSEQSRDENVKSSHTNTMQPDSLSDEPQDRIHVQKDLVRKLHNGSADSGKISSLDATSNSSSGGSIDDSLEVDRQQPVKDQVRKLEGNQALANDTIKSRSIPSASTQAKHQSEDHNQQISQRNLADTISQQATSPLDAPDSTKSQLKEHQTTKHDAVADERTPEESVTIPIKPQHSVGHKSITSGSSASSNNNNYSGLNLNMSASEMRELIARRKKFDPKKAQMNIRQKYEIIQQM